MNTNPSIYIKTAMLSSFFAVVGCVVFGDMKLGVGVAASSVLLTLNLIGWIWSIRVTIDMMKTNQTNALLTLFTGMKFILLTTCLIGILFFFGGIAVMISNTIIVFSLLLPTLLFAFQEKGMTNEC